MHKLHPIVCAALLATGAAVSSGALAQGMSNHDTPSDAANSSAHPVVAHHDRRFMDHAAQSGQAEVQASRMALSNSSNADVKNFAQQMIDDHTKANQELQGIARRLGVRLPHGPSVAQKAKLQMLRTARGEEFDQRYANEFGISAHHQAIALFQQEISKGRDRQVRDFAIKVLPKLQEHLRMAQTLQASVEPTAAVNQTGMRASQRMARAPHGDDLQDALQEVNESTLVIQKMKRDPRMVDLLRRAKGVFIMPNYGRGAFGVGVQGGEGILVKREAQGFSNPVFYNMGGVSIGAQAGGSGGELAMLLMTDRALRDFESNKKFSINADAGLTIVKYSARAQASGGKVQDVVVWSDTKGAYAGVSVGVTDVVWDDEANRAYYRRDNLDPRQILDGSIPNPQHNVIGMVLHA